MARKRDSQRNKVYAAQMDAGQWTEQYRIATWEDTVAFAKKVLTSAYFVRKYGRHSPALVYNGHRHYAMAFGWFRIEFGPLGLTRHTVLHEIAHIVRPGHRHDREWARVYLDLLRHFEGREAADRLKAAFRKRGVKFTKPRKYSPATLAAMRERGKQLAALRAANNGASAND